MKYWKDWREFWVQAFYSPPPEPAKLTDGGSPEIVLASDEAAALRWARREWPTAVEWRVLGRAASNGKIVKNPKVYRQRVGPVEEVLDGPDS